MEGRRRVKEQLKKLAAHDYAKTAFSYVERDTGREVWVEVPEQPEDAKPSRQSSKPTCPRDGRVESTANSMTTEELIAGGESRASSSSRRRGGATRRAIGTR